MTQALMIGLLPILFVAVLAMTELGTRIRLRRPLTANAAAVAAIRTSILSLMSLVLAFSFSNAASRLEESRKSIIQEVNAIETAWLRVDVVEPEVQPRLRAAFRRYVDTRVATYRIPPAAPGYTESLAASKDVEAEVWTLALEGTPVTRFQNRSLLVPALGAMSDAANVRTLYRTTHLSPTIIVFILSVVLVGSVVVGASFDAGPKRWLYRLTFAWMLSFTVFAIMDMEYARLGFFQLLKEPDAMLFELRERIARAVPAS